jgi:hypothetical protein
MFAVGAAATTLSRSFALSKVQSVDQRMRNAVSAFANCGRAVAHFRSSYVPAGTLEVKEAAN